MFPKVNFVSRINSKDSKKNSIRDQDNYKPNNNTRKHMREAWKKPANNMF
jgi:hypothetical protein